MHKKHAILYVLLALCCIAICQSCGVRKSLKNQPDLSQYYSEIPQVVHLNDSNVVSGTNFLTKNKQGLWELYVEGDPLQLGLTSGSLTKDLMYKQESVFFKKIKDLVPSKFKQSLLKKFLSWYNRKMYVNINNEYKAEIYGVSRYATDEFNSLASPYLRALYLHGAHDIGHALNDLALVGCTSFAVWDEKTEDGKLLLGRNFDFYAGNAFAEDKIIAFIKPLQGYPFMSVTWGGMIGVVSGMNTNGLTVTINAGKSQIPLVAKTPISILTREILQYASTIDEAISIAKKRQVFVSESILVGSAKDKKAVIIEVSPKNFGVYQVTNSNQIVCANHFQSEAYIADANNTKHIAESHSIYRYRHMTALLKEKEKINPKKAVEILRNKQGINGENIGYGNEKAINQLLAHHSVVFQPEDLKVWVSSNPYQLGAYVCYDLNKVFKSIPNNSRSLQEISLSIEKDPFLFTQDYKDYETYRIIKQQVLEAIETKSHLKPEIILEFIHLNPELWEVYDLVGCYYKQTLYFRAALNMFEKALTKEVTTVPDKKHLEKEIKKLKRRLRS